MLIETRLEPHHRRPQPTDRGQDRLAPYVRGLIREEEIANLILALEALSAGDAPDPEMAKGLDALSQVTGLRLDDASAIRDAIVVLGERGEALRQLRREAGSLSLSPLNVRSADGVTEGLTAILESARTRWVGMPDFEDRLHAEVDAAMAVYQKNLPVGHPSEASWWKEMDFAAHHRLVPAFARLAPELSAIETHPLKGPLLNSRILMATLFALPGILTWPVAIPTSGVMVLLALFGALVAHPLWVKHLAKPLTDLRESVQGEGPRMGRVVGETRWTEEDFSIRGVLGDLLPLLDGERFAGRADPEAARAVVGAYFDALEAPFGAYSQRSERYLHHLRLFCEGKLLQRWGVHIAAQERLRHRNSALVLDRPLATGIALGILTLPIDWLVSRISPLPQPVDLPLLFLLFFLAGFFLPRALPGTRPARRKLIEDLSAHQGELEGLP